MKKRILIVITVLVILSTTCLAYGIEDLVGVEQFKETLAYNSMEIFGENIELSDVPIDSWYCDEVDFLINFNVLSGYPDLTFRPSNNVTVGEFLKMYISLNKNINFENDATRHWASNYRDYAIENGMFVENEFTDLNKAITRGEIAKIITNTFDDYYDYPSSIKKQAEEITDKESMSEEDLEMAAKIAYLKILTGYEDGSFKFENNVTRAETAVIITRTFNFIYLEAQK